MTLSTPDQSLLHQHEIAQRPLDGLAVISPDFSFLLHQLDHSQRVSFDHIPGLKQYSALNMHTLTVARKQLLAVVALALGDMKQKTLPVRIAQQLGIAQGFFFGSAEPLQTGKSGFVVIRDHINLLGDNPLIGPNQDEFGTRFPDMTEIYTWEIRASLAHLFDEEDRAEGILVAHPAPETLSTSEQKALRKVGDCYFSVHLVPETIIARHGSMRFGSIIYSRGDVANDAVPEASVTQIFQQAVEQLF